MVCQKRSCEGNNVVEREGNHEWCVSRISHEDTLLYTKAEVVEWPQRRVVIRQQGKVTHSFCWLGTFPTALIFSRCLDVWYGWIILYCTVTSLPPNSLMVSPPGWAKSDMSKIVPSMTTSALPRFFTDPTRGSVATSSSARAGSSMTLPKRLRSWESSALGGIVDERRVRRACDALTTWQYQTQQFLILWKPRWGVVSKQQRQGGKETESERRYQKEQAKGRIDRWFKRSRPTWRLHLGKYWFGVIGSWFGSDWVHRLSPYHRRWGKEPILYLWFDRARKLRKLCLFPLLSVMVAISLLALNFGYVEKLSEIWAKLTGAS